MKIEHLDDLIKEVRQIDDILSTVGSRLNANNKIDYLSYDLLKALKQIGKQTRKHRKLCEDYCNLADFNPELIGKQEEKINKTLLEVNKEFGLNLTVEFQQDPRGNTAIIKLNDFQIWEVI